MQILMLVDSETVVDTDPDLTRVNAPPEHAKTETHVAAGLRQAGHAVGICPFGPDLADTIQQIRSLQPDLIFNLTEWYAGDRRRDADIAGMLNLLGVPYTGTGPTGLRLCRDKALCKRLLSHYRVRRPFFMVAPVGEKVRLTQMVYPAIVKPLFEDGSEGISQASLVKTESELLDRVRLIHEQQRQPAICEEFIEGREVYVGLLGHKRLRVLPTREIRFNRMEEGGPSIATARVKSDAAYRRKWDVTYVASDLPADQERRLKRLGTSIYRALSMQDYGRIDFRILPDGEIVFIEANPNPNLARDDELAEAAEQAGLAYPQLLDTIARHAASRYAH